MRQRLLCGRFSPIGRGKTTSELALSIWRRRLKQLLTTIFLHPAIIFYNGVGHVTVCYGKILATGYKGIIAEARTALEGFELLTAIMQNAAISSRPSSPAVRPSYAMRNAMQNWRAHLPALAPTRQKGGSLKPLLKTVLRCLPTLPAPSMKRFNPFWFVQMLLQMESSGPPFLPAGSTNTCIRTTGRTWKRPNHRESAQELIDCVWVKLNDLNKAGTRPLQKGFAGYSLFQNLCAGGQDQSGNDATNDLSFHCVQASMHTRLPQPSFSVRIWNGTPMLFMLKCGADPHKESACPPIITMKSSYPR